MHPFSIFFLNDYLLERFGKAPANLRSNFIAGKLADRVHLKLSEGLPTLSRFFSTKNYLKKGWQTCIEL